MKITFVGTSHGAPSAERYCSCYMIESGDSIYLVDAGAPVTDILLHSGKQIESVKAVFTTHAHSDHTAGIPFIANLMHWYFWKSSCDFYLTTQRLIDSVRNKNTAWGDGDINAQRVRFHIPEEGLVYEDGNIKVEYIKTAHTNPSYAILVTEGEKRVLFGGDFSQGLSANDVPEVVKEEIDAFICELAHFGFEELHPHLTECRAKQVFFTHVFPDSKFDEIKEKNGMYPFPIYAPDDGYVVEI
ncbi:MAG: ribonuclease Z [Ruminococcaceae bacterium]|nr:ribonuclease Z [Oscillospiraceae bacterium]